MIIIIHILCAINLPPLINIKFFFYITHKFITFAVMKDVKQVIVMRSDLKNRRGKEIAQGSHASMAFITRQMRGDSKKKLLSEKKYEVKLTKEAQQWMQEGFTKVCLKVESEKELLEVYQAASNAGLTVQLITDAGKTDAGSGKGNPTRTCIAIGPNYSEDIDKITGLRGSHSCRLY